MAPSNSYPTAGTCPKSNIPSVLRLASFGSSAKGPKGGRLRPGKGASQKRTCYVPDSANFGEHPFRDCPKRVCWVVIRYSSTHEKEIPNRPLRCRVGVHRASRAYSESCREAQ